MTQTTNIMKQNQDQPPAEQMESDANLAERLLHENKKIRAACRNAARLIGMNEDEVSMKAWGILKSVVPS